MGAVTEKWVELASRHPVKERPLGLVRQIVESLVRDPSYVLEYADEGGFRALFAVVDTCANADDSANLELLALKEPLPPAALPEVVRWAVEVAGKGPSRNLDVELWSPRDVLEAGLAPLGFTRAYVTYHMERRTAELPATAPPPLPEGARWELLEPARFGEYHAVLGLALAGLPGANVPNAEEMARALGRRTFLPEVLVHQGSVVAFADTRVHDDGTGEIHLVGRHPAWRGRGLGDTIILRALDRLSKNGATRIALEVAAVNETALAVYRRYGFVIVDEVPVWRRSLRG
jgi:ribosomal protein S18 acetylase RimI-like enzyme